MAHLWVEGAGPRPFPFEHDRALADGNGERPGGERQAGSVLHGKNPAEVCHNPLNYSLCLPASRGARCAASKRREAHRMFPC
ncbi:hypothetical protein L602_000600000480 [Cupriavidus gilardii J11]|uniref:Uncharacterized protein n=1 Tax=Cupriavidus gilardii J11 TaxID=936133 RepID=A0A562B3Q9_9BURK|nr:hypothetical protein L602_000600000480 [Cupriavidus gilardii J11]